MKWLTCFNFTTTRQVDQCFMIFSLILSLISVNIDPVISYSPITAMTGIPSSNSLANMVEDASANIIKMAINITTTKSSLEGEEVAIRHTRTKRGVIQLAGMISCVAGCDPLIYKGYGCYCGYSGSGTPVDGIDRCCMKHDLCYTRTGCSQFKQYALSYSWDCITHGFASCEAAYSEGSCAVRLCRCDLKFAHCLNAYHCPMGRATCPSSKLRSIFSLMMPFG